MSDTTTSGDRGIRATSQLSDPMLDDDTDLSVNAPGEDVPKPSTVSIVGRSPGQLAWLRLKRDRVAVSSAWLLGVTTLVVLLAPLIQWLYGDDPEIGHSDLLDSIGYPLGVAGGVSGDHWLGLTPQGGYDMFLQLIFGARTSLGIAVTSAVLSVAFGVVIGIMAGYAGGWIDRFIVWVTDFMLAFPFFLFAIALVPAVTTRLSDEYGAVAVWKRVLTIIIIFTVFGWMGTARIVRGQDISLREREYVEAARAAGAGTTHMLFRQLLPNIWAPVLVVFSLLVPATVTAEAALSFLNIGIQEPVPDLGRLILQGARNVSNTGLIPIAVFVPAVGLFVLVLAFNLLGDAVRDALDPKSSK
jgi:peptide/nickel transport system permease protein